MYFTLANIHKLLRDIDVCKKKKFSFVYTKIRTFDMMYLANILMLLVLY